MAKIDGSYKVIAQESLDGFVDELQKAIDDQFIKGTEKNVQDAINQIKDLSQEYVPLDTGRTQRSWFDEITITGTVITGTFGYDKEGQIDYLGLIYVNPNKRFSFAPSHGKGQTKARDHWLEAAMEERRSEVIQELSKKPK